jgi:hypothetical protein
MRIIDSVLGMLFVLSIVMGCQRDSKYQGTYLV